MSESKLLLRKKLRTKRMQLSENYKLQASSNLKQQAIINNIFDNKNNIAAYLPINNEIDPQPLLDYCLQKNKQCFLPIIEKLNDSKNISKKLIFARYTNKTELIKNKFGILEPLYNKKLNKKPNKNNNIISILDLSLILLPVVGFDKDGHRLGMGGGYYDNTLASIKNYTPRPVLIGLAYAMQEVDKIPVDSNDIDLDAVITDEKYFTQKYH